MYGRRRQGSGGHEKGREDRQWTHHQRTLVPNVWQFSYTVRGPPCTVWPPQHPEDHQVLLPATVLGWRGELCGGSWLLPCVCVCEMWSHLSHNILTRMEACTPVCTVSTSTMYVLSNQILWCSPINLLMWCGGIFCPLTPLFLTFSLRKTQFYLPI